MFGCNKQVSVKGWFSCKVFTLLFNVGGRGTGGASVTVISVLV